MPIVTAVVVLALWRSLWGASETLTLRLAALLFLLGFAGLVVSLWPYIVPRHIPIWGGAGDPQTLWFAGVGIVIIIPFVLASRLLGVSRQDGRRPRRGRAPSPDPGA